MKYKSYMERFLLLSLFTGLLYFTGFQDWGNTLEEDGSGPAPVQAAQKQPQQKAAQPKTLTGTIVRKGDQFILRASSGDVYTLDDSVRAQPFEGKVVNVTGGLDEEARLIHVFWIEVDWA